MTVGAARCKRGRGCVVATLRTALRMDGYGRCEEEKGNSEAQGNTAERRPDHWKKASKTKRKIQNRPIVCQYQAVQSTRI